VSRDSFKLAGVGAVACVACCAGPLLGFIAAVGVATVLGYVLFGLVAIAVGTALVALVLQARAKRRVTSGTTPVQIIDRPPR
jgi:hypothetical protein